MVDEVEFVPNRLVRWPKSQLLCLIGLDRGLLWGGANNFPVMYSVLETPLLATSTVAFV